MAIGTRFTAHSNLFLFNVKRKKYFVIVFYFLHLYQRYMIQVVLSTVGKTHGTHRNGDPPLMPFLTMKKDEQRVVFDVPIKSVK